MEGAWDLDGIIQMHKAPRSCPASGLPLAWENELLYWVSWLVLLDFQSIQTNTVSVNLEESVGQPLNEPQCFGGQSLKLLRVLLRWEATILPTRTVCHSRNSHYRENMLRAEEHKFGTMSVDMRSLCGLLPKFESNLWLSWIHWFRMNFFLKEYKERVLTNCFRLKAGDWAWILGVRGGERYP